MRRMLRLTVISFLCTVLLVLAGALREQVANARTSVSHDAVEASVAPAALPVLASARVEASTLDVGMLGGASRGLFEMTILEPAPAAVLPPEPDAVPLPWTPPEWFPEAQAEALHAVDHIAQSPNRIGPDLKLRSRSVFVYDLEAGQALLAKNADDRRPVASLTKVISALTVASESPDLDAEHCLDMSSRPSWPGAVSRLRTGTCTSGWDLLGAALVRSDNGAAIALSQVAGLPHYPFIERMNTVAAELGMDQSSFSDPSGVEDDNLSTARDMTKAVVAAALHPTVHPVASAPYWDLTDTTRDRTRRLYTTNKLVKRGGTEILAAKTGYTDTARHCFTGVFRLRDGRKVALTVLGGYWSRHRWSDLRTILAWIERGAPGAGEPA